MVAHDLRAGGRVEYHMTGPAGDKHGGLWEVLEVDPPRSLVFRDLFADEDGNPNLQLPAMTGSISIEAIGAGRTRMSIENSFRTREAMDTVLAMGVEDGMSQALGQIDAILADSAVNTGVPS
jgi:uncharacterized protein YndB with AHSA1/START domain